MPKKLALRCKDCKQFYLRTGKCAWDHVDCHGPDCTFAEECPLFTDQNGYAPLLDCDEDQLPAWYRQKELFDYEPQTTNTKTSSRSDGRVTQSRKRTNKRSGQQQTESLAFWP